MCDANSMGCCPLKKSLLSPSETTVHAKRSVLSRDLDNNDSLLKIDSGKFAFKIAEVFYPRHRETRGIKKTDFMDNVSSQEDIELKRQVINKQIKLLEEDYIKIVEAEKELKRIERELKLAEKDHVDWMKVKHDMAVSQRGERRSTRMSADVSQMYRFDISKPFNFTSILESKASVASTRMLVDINGEKEKADDYLASLNEIGSKCFIGPYRLITLLGKGCCGKVFMSFDTRERKKVALKVIKKSPLNVTILSNEKMVKDIMPSTWHPFIAKIFSLYQTNGHFVFVMEFLEGRTLNTHLSNEKHFSEDRTRFYAACILLAIGYLHSIDIAHRDVKLENIVLDRMGYPKLVDFGMAEENVKHNTPIFEKSGTRLYQGPEFYVPGMITRRSSDFWALGVMIHAMLTGKFISINPIIIIDHPHLSRTSNDLLKKMFATQPLERLGAGPRGARDLMRHSFFKKCKWDDLLERKVTAPTFVVTPFNIMDVTSDWLSIKVPTVQKVDMGLKDVEWLEVREMSSINIF